VGVAAHHPTRRRGERTSLATRAAAHQRWRAGLLPLLVARAGHLAALVRVAGIRWCVEECFQAGKSEVGLDEHQVRKWTSWYRYTTLVMLAHAILAVIAAHERDKHAANDGELIPLTVNEIRHLFAKVITNTVRNITYWPHWSAWRRRHQQRARTSHYRRRGAEIDRHPST
jgi:hypothetical protein